VIESIVELKAPDLAAQTARLHRKSKATGNRSSLSLSIKASLLFSWFFCCSTAMSADQQERFGEGVDEFVISGASVDRIEFSLPDRS
jgi:hypothetical protein